VTAATATLCRCCAGAHPAETTYACSGCSRVLCRSMLGDYESSGWHVVTTGSRRRICGRLARLEVRSDLTIQAKGWRVPA